MDRYDKIVFSLGAFIGASVAMLVTHIRGYSAAAKAVKAAEVTANEDYDVGETAAENPDEQGEGE
jgi:hypothetical protein